jgi:hypothetical protein
MNSLLTILVLTSTFLATNSFAAHVEIFDRQSGQALPTYVKHGRLYIAGEPGHEYEIRVRNEGLARVLAVTTVDGVNVITGETGSFGQSGYVLDGYADVRIEGWRKSMSRTAAFYFTKLSNSYAAKTGRPENVGVIGVALFRERIPCCRHEEELHRSSRADDFDAQDSGPADRSANRAPAPALKEHSAKADSPARLQAESKLGTGHGRSEHSAARYTEFVRASSTPNETIVIYYDSERNLIAQGIIPQARVAARPRPFPGGFAPDP